MLKSTIIKWSGSIVAKPYIKYVLYFYYYKILSSFFFQIKRGEYYSTFVA